MFKNKDKYIEKINYNKTVALIPARGGSKGVVKKNIQILRKYPLIAYSVVAARLSTQIDRVIVTTDSQEIAEVALKYGAEIPFIRPKEYATDVSGDIAFVEHFIKFAAENEGTIPEYIVHLRPTTPLRDVEIMDRAILECKRNKDCCSLRSGHKASESPYKWFLKNKDGYFKPLSDKITNDEANLGRQSFPDVYIPDGYVDVLKSDYIIQNDILHGKNMLGYESPYCQEVDTLDDLELLRYELNKNQSALYKKIEELENG